ncbi:CG7914, partial [Drosophila busckii]
SNNEVNESDCCGNGCSNCILDNKPKPSQRALLAGRPNVILNYAKFKLLSNEPCNGDQQVRCLHFVYAESEDKTEQAGILDIPPGHHVMLRMDQQASPLLRPYSPYWTDFASKEFKLLVKLQPGGAMSAQLSGLQLEQVLQFRGPIGNYMHDASSAKNIFIIAQGVAIAPTMPLVAQVLDNEDDMSRVRHLICAKDLKHVYLRDQLLEFGKYWNYSSCLYLSQQQTELTSSLRYKESAHLGRLNIKDLAAQAPKGIEDAKIIVIIAGYANFQRDMREQALQALPVAAANIFAL